MTAPHRSVRQDAAPLCLSIRIVSGIVLLLAVLLTAASLYESALFPMVILLVFGIALAYGLSPVKYAIEQGSLVVRRRWDTKTFASVVRCSIPAGPAVLHAPALGQRRSVLRHGHLLEPAMGGLPRLRDPVEA